MSGGRGHVVAAPHVRRRLPGDGSRHLLTAHYRSGQVNDTQAVIWLYRSPQAAVVGPRVTAEDSAAKLPSTASP